MVMESLKDKIELIHKKILIKEDSFDKVSENGLKFLSKEEKKTIGSVVLNNSITSNYPIGDRVVYPQFAGVNVEISGERYKVLETREIFFTFNDKSIEAKNGFIVVKPINKNNTITSNGLKLVKDEEISNTNGLLISLSDETTINACVGDEVVFSRYSGFTLIIRDEPYIVLSEEEIFFLIKNRNKQ